MTVEEVEELFSLTEREERERIQLVEHTKRVSVREIEAQPTASERSE